MTGWWNFAVTDDDDDDTVHSILFHHPHSVLTLPRILSDTSKVISDHGLPESDDGDGSTLIGRDVVVSDWKKRVKYYLGGGGVMVVVSAGSSNWKNNRPYWWMYGIHRDPCSDHDCGGRDHGCGVVVGSDPDERHFFGTMMWLGCCCYCAS